MSEINTKIFKPQKWVLDVLNSPKGETVEFGDIGNFIKINDKVPEDLSNRVAVYLFNDTISAFYNELISEMDPSVYEIMNHTIVILTSNVDDFSKGIYVDEGFFEFSKEAGMTEFYLVFQTTQDFSISKKTIEGEVHPIEEKYIPGGSNKIDIILHHDYDAGYFLYNAEYNDSEISQDDLFELLQTKDANITIEYLDVADKNGDHFYVNPINQSDDVIAINLKSTYKSDDMIIYTAVGYVKTSGLSDSNTVVCTLRIIPEGGNLIYMACNCFGDFIQM